MKRELALNGMWVRDCVGRLGYLIHSPNGWDVAYSDETKQSVDLSDYFPADPADPSPPPVVEVRGKDSAGGLKERKK